MYDRLTTSKKHIRYEEFDHYGFMFSGDSDYVDRIVSSIERFSGEESNMEQTFMVYLMIAIGVVVFCTAYVIYIVDRRTIVPC